MFSTLPKKILIIGALGVVVVLLLVGFLYQSRQKPLLKPFVADMGKATTKTMLDYKDPLGFSFSYPSSFLVNTHSEDKDNYANIELFTPDKTSNIKFVVSDTNYQDIEDWAKQDTEIKSGSNLDSKLGNLTAKKVYLDKANKIVLGTIWDGMLFKVEVMPASNTEIVKTVDTILTNLNIPEKANYTNSSPSDSVDSSQTSSGEQEEEVVE